MENNKLFLPINNQYSSIDLPNLKDNNFKTISMSPQRNRNRLNIEMSTVSKEIVKYKKLLLNSPETKENKILKNKVIMPQESNKLIIKRSNYEQIDMLTYKPKQKEIDTIIQNYIKSFSTLDLPLAQTKNTIYEFNKKSKLLDRNNIYKILKFSFYEMNSVISKPYYKISANNIIINLFFFVINNKLFNKNFLNFYLFNLEGLTGKLSRYFNKPVKLELTQLYSVSHNSQILIDILGKLGLSRRNSFSRIITRFLSFQSQKFMFRSNLIKFSRYQTILTGINFKLGGRLMKGKIVPRRTSKQIQYGSLSRMKSNYISNARLTQKNKRGTFSLTVSIGHKFF